MFFAEEQRVDYGVGIAVDEHTPERERVCVCVRECICVFVGV